MSAKSPLWMQLGWTCSWWPAKDHTSGVNTPAHLSTKAASMLDAVHSVTSAFNVKFNSQISSIFHAHDTGTCRISEVKQLHHHKWMVKMLTCTLDTGRYFAASVRRLSTLLSLLSTSSRPCKIDSSILVSASTLLHEDKQSETPTTLLCRTGHQARRQS